MRRALAMLALLDCVYIITAFVVLIVWLVR